MRQPFSNLKAAFQHTVNTGCIAFFRRLERHLSPDTLFKVLWPVCLARATLNNLFKKTTPPPMPDFLRSPRTLQARIRQRASLYLDDVLLYFPDRLYAPKWLARCQIEGLARLAEARQRQRPVVLAFWHFGSFQINHCWLRGGHNLPVCGLVGGNSSWRTNLARLQDRLLPLPALPVALYPDELRELARFVSAGNITYIAIDAPAGKQLSVPFCDGWDFQLATGAIRLASHYQAELIPCCITNEGSWRYRIYIGQPVPSKHLAADGDWLQVGQHLLSEMLPQFRNRPHQCLDAMTRRFVKKKKRLRKKFEASYNCLHWLMDERTDRLTSIRSRPQSKFFGSAFYLLFLKLLCFLFGGVYLFFRHSRRAIGECLLRVHLAL